MLACFLGILIAILHAAKWCMAADALVLTYAGNAHGLLC